MTSKFSIDNRDLLQRISSGEAVVGIDFGNLIVRELAAFRMAAMDSEPVVEIMYHPLSIDGGKQKFVQVTGEEHRQLRDLVMMVKMLCRTVRKYTPKSQQAENFTAYLQKEGLISAADCLRDSDPLDTELEDSRG